ncbi:MAG: hypothetical protein ACJAV4_000792 [Pontimonas sp.]
MSQPPLTVRTNGLSIASLILSILGFSIVGAILGHVALSQIKRTNEAGSGLAIAGIILGWLSFAGFLLVGITIAGISLSL